MYRQLIIAACAGALVLGATGPSVAQVNVNIGINLPAPPPLVAIPSTPVQYAPGIDANYFFYGGEYFVYTNGQWYASPTYNGPWAYVAPEYVPLPLLQVPVRYYHRPPAEWRAWHREAPPRWAPAWGRRWEERRSAGQAQPRLERRDERRDDARDHREDRRDDRREEHGDRHEGRR